MPSAVSFRRGIQRHFVRAIAASALALGAASSAQADVTVWHATFQVISTGSVGTFGFHGANLGGLSNDFSITTLTPGDPAQLPVVLDVETASTGILTVTSVPTGFSLTDGWCSDDNGTPGNRVAGVTLAGSTFTLPAGTMTADRSYTCTVKFNYAATVPTLGEYGLGALALLMGGGAALGLRRRRRAA